MSNNILLRNGSVIVHDEHDRVQVLDNCDVLISNGFIEQVGKNIPPVKDTDILDCTDKIISPGFVDTHHHLWQTQLKGYGLDNTWLDYFSDDLLQSFNYSPDDSYWGQLAGCLEALDAGTTFVLDHCHGCRTPEHAEAAITALSDSGIRGVFAYAETFLNLCKWDSQSVIPRPTSVSDSYIQHLEHLAQKGSFADGRVTIGVAFDNYHLPRHEVEKLFHRAIKAGVKLITTHCGNFGPSAPQVLDRYSLFPKAEDDYTIVLSHGNYLDKTDLTMLSQRQIPLSCTPATESQGYCHFLTSSSLMQAARNALLLARLQKTLELKSEGRKPVKFDETVYDVFNKATIQGARAVRMQDQIGSIQTGKRADILVFTRTSSLSFGTAARQNPVAAIVGYSEPRDIEAVLVGGVFRKRAGTLLPILRNGKTVGLDSIMSEFADPRDIKDGFFHGNGYGSFIGTQLHYADNVYAGSWGVCPVQLSTSDTSNAHLGEAINEPDDQMSLVRLLTYANEIDIQGIAVTTSTWMPDKIDYESVVGVLGGYKKVVDNLNANVPSHASYPSYKYMLDRIHKGHPVYGRKSLNMTLSDGAKALTKAADAASTDDPLTVSIWGGSAILAESLQHVSRTRNEAAVDSFVEKLRVYAISDQDDTGVWIRLRYPQLMYVTSLHGFSEYTDATWNGISGEEYRHFDQGGPDSSIVSNDWLEKNIRLGPLGSHYLNWSFIMEGDTPAFLPLVQNGLGDVNRPDFGSWGGRYTLLDHSGQSKVYADTTDYVVGKNGKSFTSKFATIWRWREDYQFDFAARMKWSVNSNYSENNHQPVAIVNGSCGPASLKLKYKPGQSIVLDASDSWDPDGDELKYDWFHYREPGGAYGRGLEGFDPSLKMKPILTTQSPNVNITNLTEDGSIVKLETAKKLNDTLHIILALRDATEQPLATYRRVILEAR
ncbi:unnamed protein product [Fusarium graminearum]|nr:unnamed protein product [Fusarium graminearum]